MNDLFRTMVICFQADETKVGPLHPEMDRLLRKLMVKFVPLRLFRGQTDLRTVDFANRTNQHQDDMLAVGMAARPFLALEEDEGGVPYAKEAVFFQLVLSTYPIDQS